MLYTVENLTHDRLQSIFPEGIKTYGGLKIKGMLQTWGDLRKKVLKAQEVKGNTRKRKFANVEETKKLLESDFPNAEIFINKTMPNIHLNGCKCYIICTASAVYRLGIMHKEATFDEMQLIAEREGVPTVSKRHILFNNIDYETMINLIKLLCK